MTQKNRGFTIVELLIVIVVIAILAMISIVAYNGVQARAKATAVEETVDKYRNMLVQYATINRQYPSGTDSVCLGAVANYPDGCYTGASATSTTENGLKTVAKTLPQVDTVCNNMGEECRRNLLFMYQSNATLDGVAHPYYMVYYLQKGQPCKLGGNVGGTWEHYTKTPNSTKYFEHDNDSQVSMCILSLPDPAKM